MLALDDLTGRLDATTGLGCVTLCGLRQPGRACMPRSPCCGLSSSPSIVVWDLLLLLPIPVWV
jgi:hypothetical protein